jgi:hypothetical protein
MLDQYLGDENFKKWYNHNLFISSLTGDPIICTIVLGNNNNLKVVFLSGHLINYKSFIAHFSKFKKFNYFRAYGDRRDTPDEILDIFIKTGIVSKKENYHPYHKKAKPVLNYSAGSRWDYVYNKIVEDETEKFYYIEDILNGEMEPRYEHSI